jgi:hypothetical protein
MFSWWGGHHLTLLRIFPQRFFKDFFDTEWFYALFHGWKFAHQMPFHSQEICPSFNNKTKLAGIFLQIPANFEIIINKSAYLRLEYAMYLESLQIQFSFKNFCFVFVRMYLKSPISSRDLTYFVKGRNTSWVHKPIRRFQRWRTTRLVHIPTTEAAITWFPMMVEIYKNIDYIAYWIFSWGVNWGMS